MSPCMFSFTITHRAPSQHQTPFKSNSQVPWLQRAPAILGVMWVTWVMSASAMQSAPQSATQCWQTSCRHHCVAACAAHADITDITDISWHYWHADIIHSIRHDADSTPISHITHFTHITHSICRVDGLPLSRAFPRRSPEFFGSVYAYTFTHIHDLGPQFLQSRSRFLIFALTYPSTSSKTPSVCIQVHSETMGLEGGYPQLVANANMVGYW